MKLLVVYQGEGGLENEDLRKKFKAQFSYVRF